MDRVRRLCVSALCLSVLVFSGVAGVPAVAKSSTAGKTCHTVTKKVHGKKHKVKVCSKRKKAPAPTPTPTAPPVPTTPNPLTVGLVPDTTRTAGADITVANGGSITATAADGTTFTLTIPKGALIADTHISVVPLTRIDNYPFSTPGSGVELEPSGLLIMQPMTLTITPPSGTPRGSFTAFASTDAGADFHLYPATSDASTITLPIYHFSGYGYGPASDGELQAQAQRVPASPQAQEEQLRNMMDADRQADANHQPYPYSPDQIFQQIEATWQAKYDDEVLPEMKAALDSDDEDAITTAVRDGQGLARSQLLMIGDVSPYNNESLNLQGLAQQLIVHFLDVAYGHCVRKHDLSKLDNLAGLAHYFALVGETSTSSDEAVSRFNKCANFEADVSVDLHASRNTDVTQGINHVTDHYAWTAHVTVEGLHLRFVFPTLEPATDHKTPTYSTNYTDAWVTSSEDNGKLLAKIDDTFSQTGSTAPRDVAATLFLHTGPPSTDKSPPHSTLTFDLDPGDIVNQVQEQVVCEAGPCHNSTKNTSLDMYPYEFQTVFDQYLHSGQAPNATYEFAGIAGIEGTGSVTLTVPGTPSNVSLNGGSSTVDGTLTITIRHTPQT